MPKIVAKLSKVTTKLSLTCSPSFTGYEASRLDHFSDMHLRDVTLYYRFGVLICLNASECSSRVMPSCYSGARLQPYSQLETLNSPNLFTMSASSSLRDLQEGLLKVYSTPGGSSSPSSNPHDDLTAQVAPRNDFVYGDKLLRKKLGSIS